MDKIEILIAQGVTEREDMERLTGLTPKQIRSALCNLTNNKRIRVVRRISLGRAKGFKQSIYEIGMGKPKEPIRWARVNSVFQLGSQ